ncbi:threonine-phosphate decarboxylase CobD [Telmatospirillum sp. J64-1]|uniref:threonine-phosphate decarboxylase CobD n=1 Tax=Telmatospirillum sp. J64-1 TaxID=2502183 RepID=UPI00115CE04D|nr:threonine-phosphate decarboxylase CobD [Telmatospirillum sp. J64-1]
MIFDPSSGLPVHGGDLAGAEARFGRPDQGWLDLSTGINPHSYPLPALTAESWTRLPDAGADLRLREAAAACYGAPGPDHVAAAAGTQALIQWLPRLLPPGMVAVSGPTYGEHAKAWESWGHEVVEADPEEAETLARVIVVVNPNNPDGRSHDPEALAALAERMAARGGLLVVDEAFCDVTPELSAAGRLRTGMVVLRSFGKFYGLAGLRLGFALAEPDLAACLRKWLGPWSVPGPAVAVGCRALADRDWAEAMRTRLAEEARMLDEVLRQAGLAIIGGTSLFRLAGAPRAWALYEHLARSGILVRPFSHSPRWLRFGLPPDDAARRRLAQALADWRG